MKNNSSLAKKEILFPSLIGDWTKYQPKDLSSSISIRRNIGNASKNLSNDTIEWALFFHQSFFEKFFNALESMLDSHIILNGLSINTSTHQTFMDQYNEDLYLSKYTCTNLEQIDLALSEKTAKFLAHRLCGGTTPPEPAPLTDVETSILGVIQTLFYTELATQWRSIFTPYAPNLSAHFGHYTFQSQQHESETIVELEATFELFKQKSLSVKLLYSLETIEKLIYFYDQLNHNIQENIQLKPNTLKQTQVPVTGILGTTSLSLNDLQHLEAGDVILLDESTLDQPIQLIIDDSLVFKGMPIQQNHHVGVQVVSHPNYKAYVADLQKPSEIPPINQASSAEDSSPVLPTEDSPSVEDTMIASEVAPSTESDLTVPLDPLTDTDQPIESPIDSTAEIDYSDEPMVESDLNTDSDYLEDHDDMHTNESEDDLETSDLDLDGDDFSWDDLD